MRQFTDAEKQLLQAKIKDEQERREQAVKEIARRIEEEASKSRAVSRTPSALGFLRRTLPELGSFWKYGFLAVILCLLVFNVIMVLIWRNPFPGQYAHPMYANVVCALMLLFNHIAFYITNGGWQSRVMKTVAWIWIVIGSAYILWLFGVLVTDMIVVADGRMEGHYYVL